MSLPITQKMYEILEAKVSALVEKVAALEAAIKKLNPDLPGMPPVEARETTTEKPRRRFSELH